MRLLSTVGYFQAAQLGAPYPGFIAHVGDGPPFSAYDARGSWIRVQRLGR
jgi:hypothetical protein